MNTIVHALGPHAKISEVKYWTDGMIVLYWFQNRGEWKVFVQHRVREILELTEKSQLGHVSGLENLADLGSRGITASQLCDKRLWWEGLQCLKGSPSGWPNDTYEIKPIEVKT